MIYCLRRREEILRGKEDLRFGARQIASVQLIRELLRRGEDGGE